MGTKGQNKTGLIVTIVVLGVTLLGVSAFALFRNTGTNNVKVENTSQSDTSQSQDTPNTESETETDTPKDESTPTVDPSTLASIDIEPMSVTVYYTKGLQGFEFAVKRTADRTEYVEFTAPALVGTKCTNDAGLFASIIKNPTSPEDKTTIAATTKAGNDTYGLSLASNACTPDEALLDQYQTAFKNGFSSLKVMDAED